MIGCTCFEKKKSNGKVFPHFVRRPFSLGSCLLPTAIRPFSLMQLSKDI
jgi:hypothetical protein